MTQITTAREFWDTCFARGHWYSRPEVPHENDPTLSAALRHFGDVAGKTLVDVGCGRGSSSLYFARAGAKVISVDFSQVAVDNLNRYCAENGIDNIRAVRMGAQDVGQLGKVDFVFGSMILHHIEPFHEFAATLRSLLKSEGKAFFYENSARSRLMIWFRQNVIGKLWIPKVGDAEEFPLTPKEVDELRRHFHVDVEIPFLLYFEMIARYIFRGLFRGTFRAIDKYCFKHWTWIRKYSYRQYLRLS